MEEKDKKNTIDEVSQKLYGSDFASLSPWGQAKVIAKHMPKVNAPHNVGLDNVTPALATENQRLASQNDSLIKENAELWQENADLLRELAELRAEIQ